MQPLDTPLMLDSCCASIRRATACNLVEPKCPAMVDLVEPTFDLRMGKAFEKLDKPQLITLLSGVSALTAAALQAEVDHVDPEGYDEAAPNSYDDACLDLLRHDSDFWLEVPASSWQALQEEIMAVGLSDDDDLRSALLEEQFDATPERLRAVMSRFKRKWASKGLDGNVRSAAQLEESLALLGLKGIQEEQLSRVYDAVTRHMQFQEESPGIQVLELEAAFTLLKLAQVLGRGPGSVAETTPAGQLRVIDYNADEVYDTAGTGRELVEFFMGRRPIQGVPGLPLVTWAHLKGHPNFKGNTFPLLLGLALKCRLPPVIVDDIIQQCPTKVGVLGSKVCIMIDHLAVEATENLFTGQTPVRTRGKHLTIIFASSSMSDIVITIVQPNNGDELVESLSGTTCSMDKEDAWLSMIQKWIHSGRAKVCDRGGMALVQEILQFCCSDLVDVSKAFANRLLFLDGELSSEPGPPSRGWLQEVSMAKLQLSLLQRRLRSMCNMLRQLKDSAAGAASGAAFIIDQVSEALDNCQHLEEQCAAMTVAYEMEMSRDEARQRQVAHEHTLASDAEKEIRDTQLNNILFCMSAATVIAMPCQFMAGVYGMNFNIDGVNSIPELLWPRGYLYFWMINIGYLCMAIPAAICMYLRLHRGDKARKLLKGTSRERLGE